MVEYVLLLSARELHYERKVSKIFKFVGELIESINSNEKKTEKSVQLDYSEVEESKEVNNKKHQKATISCLY